MEFAGGGKRGFLPEAGKMKDAERTCGAAADGWYDGLTHNDWMSKGGKRMLAAIGRCANKLGQTVVKMRAIFFDLVLLSLEKSVMLSHPEKTKKMSVRGASSYE
jgi:hypothetical protein